MKKRTAISLILTALAMVGTHKLWHHASVLVFVSLLILSFLLAYKITDYIADYKTSKHQSRIEIIFLVIFFVLLFIPMSHINPAKRSYEEGRNLAVFEPLIQNRSVNYEFGKNFNEYFNDRFAFRNQLIYTKAFINMKLERKIKLANNIYIDKDKLFLQKNLLPDSLKMNKDELESAISAISQLNKFCIKNNIKLYVLIVPTKNLVYEKDWNYLMKKETRDLYNSQIELIRNKSGANVIYPLDTLLQKDKNLEEPLYYKTDNHWTEDGAYIGCSCLIDAIKKDFKDVNIVNKNDLKYFYLKKIPTTAIPERYGYGNIYRPFKFYMKLTKYKKGDEYKYYEYKPEMKQTLVDTERVLGYNYHYNQGSGHKVLLIGTSMNSALIKFLPYSFRDLKYINLNDRPVGHLDFERFKIMKYYRDIIDDYNPDILIYSVSVSNLKEEVGQIFKN